MTAVLIILGLAILLEGCFSGAEIALVAADKIKLRHMAEGGGKKGRIILDFLDDPGELISTSLVGTNICVVLSTVVATLTLLKWYPQQAELMSLLVMAPLVLVFGEIIPKSLFQNYADLVAPRAIYALWICRFLFYPLVATGTALSNLLLRLFRLDLQPQVQMSRQELSLLIRLPSREGADRITPDERKMVARIFDFKETTVEQVMIHLSETTALPVESSVEDLAQVIADKRHTRIPLYEERLDQIVGIVHAFDVLRAQEQDLGRPCDLCRPPVFVPESQPAVDTLMRLKREGQGMAVVVDEYGGATGVVTVEDILEEVVGEIDDEYDRGERELFVREPGGTFRIHGRAPIDRVNEALKLSLPEDEDQDYESIAGLILDQLKRIPGVGEEVQIAGVTLTVTKATERSIEEVRLRPIKSKP